MKLAIVACDIFKLEIESLTENDPDFVIRDYLEFAIHENPELLLETVKEHVNALKGKVDAVFLGYGICSSLKNVTEILEVPTVMLEGCDCIEVFLGKDEYEREKSICPGTWFSSPGWAIEGIAGLTKEMHLDCMEGIDPMEIIDMLFESYERVLNIDTGVGDKEDLLIKSQAVADALKLPMVTRGCDLRHIEEGIRKTKELAKSLS